MKSKPEQVQITIFVMTVFLFTCTTVLSQYKKGNVNLNDLAWLSGTWERTNSKPGRSGNEHWAVSSSTEMLGYGITMKGSDTLFMEKLKIIATDTGLYYIGDVPENKKPIAFKLTSSTSTSYTFENASHDFPKRIVYKREPGKLYVVVSGDGKSIEYFFIKK